MIAEPVGKKIVGVVQGVFKHHSCKPAANANQNTEKQDKLSLFDMTQPPY